MHKLRRNAGLEHHNWASEPVVSRMPPPTFCGGFRVTPLVFSRYVTMYEYCPISLEFISVWVPPLVMQ